MENVRINTPINVKLANNIFINHGCEIDASRATIEIGNDVSIGIGTLILSFDHRFDLTETPIRMQGVTAKSVNIKNDVWIGANVTILSGVTISSGAVIGAGAVVTKDVAPYTVVAGVPAKIIRSRLVGKGKRKNA